MTRRKILDVLGVYVAMADAGLFLVAFVDDVSSYTGVWTYLWHSYTVLWPTDPLYLRTKNCFCQFVQVSDHWIPEQPIFLWLKI